MNYSTFDNKNFYIKKDSTLPVLKFPLIQQIREKYDLTEDMLDNVAVTFSMIDIETGIYRIANVAANLVINNDRDIHPDEEKYTLTYKFNLNNTKVAGRFNGEFKIDILSPNYCGKLTFPTESYINIIISDSLTKTTVI